jgi:hypothetical protein
LKKKEKTDHLHHDCCEEEDGLDNLYSDNQTRITKQLLDEFDEEEEEFTNVKKGKKKNKFKIQNGWLPPSDYRSYQ